VATLVACLNSLRAEFNTINPSRDKTSDGWIGDAAHAKTPSDHNPDSRGLVHAIDVDQTGPWPAGFTMRKAVEEIVRRHRVGVDDRLQNVIYNRRIWSRSWGWTPRTYTGVNPHDKHAHFSCRHNATQENNTRGWGLVALAAPPKPTTQEDDVDVDDLLNADRIGNDINPGTPGKPGHNETMSVAWALRYASRAQLALQEIRAVRTELAALRTRLDAIGTAVDAEVAEEVPTADENAQAVINALDAGSPEDTAAALRVVLGDDAAEVGRLLLGA
jgi:hypothetical protein